MPQTITPRVHCTVKLPANDLARVNYAGSGGIFIRNYGPGDVWLSADPQYPASITLMSGQANTQVSIAFSSK
jgi:hypothetical protein